MVNLYPLFFDLTTLELYLLEKTLITMDFPNLSNAKTGDLNRNILLNVDEDIQIMRKYCINLLLGIIIY